MSKRNSQIWLTDFIIGVLIFLIVILIFYKYAYNLNEDPNKVSIELLMDAKSISNSLITTGSPENWNQTNVSIIGLTDGNQRLVQNKLDMFANISYSSIRTYLRTSYDFYLTLEYFNKTNIPINGSLGIGMAPNDADNLIRISRIVIYDSGLINMVVTIWQ